MMTHDISRSNRFRYAVNMVIAHSQT